MSIPAVTRRLAEFASRLEFDDVPVAVLRKTEEFLLDWIGSALAGKSARPVESISKLASHLGPAHGPSQILTNRAWTSPLFAAMVNAAASHAVEQDDVHNGSVFHPATVVFPAALAVAQAKGQTGRDLLVAAIAGYEVGIRVGEFLGRTHYKVFHTTGTAGCIAAAASAGRLLRLPPVEMLHAFGSAGTQAAGLWEFLRDAGDSKLLHTAHAASTGVFAAYLANDGFTGATRILEGDQGMGAGMSRDADPAKLVDGLGSRWAITETSFKIHASCRHTHPSADALLQVMRSNRLCAGQIRRVKVGVHQSAIDVLGSVNVPKSVHQAKFSMGTVLGLIAIHGRAGLTEFDAHFQDSDVAAFRNRVEMVFDKDIDAAYPARWIGKIVVEIDGGTCFSTQIDEPKGDPGNTLNRAEVEDKAFRLARYGGGATESDMRSIIDLIWRLSESRELPVLPPFS